MLDKVARLPRRMTTCPAWVVSAIKMKAFNILENNCVVTTYLLNRMTVNVRKYVEKENQTLVM